MSSTVWKDNFGRLFDHYVTTIVKSGMLLDEDLEVLIESYDAICFPAEKHEFPYHLLASLALFLGPCLGMKLYNASPFYVVPSVVVSAICVATEIQNWRIKQRYHNLVNEVIMVFRLLSGLTVRIVKYIKIRHKAYENYDSSLSKHFNKQILKFVDAYTRSQKEMWVYYMNDMKHISKYSSKLKTDYCYYSSINITELVKEPPDCDIKGMIGNMETLHQIQILLNSKLLGYLGVLLCDKNSRLNHKTLKFLLDCRISNLVKCARYNYDHISKLFFCLRDSLLRCTNFIDEKSKLAKTIAPTRLNDSLDCTLDNIGFMAEKTRNILQLIANGENKEKIGKALFDLRNHTLAAYDCLDVLCKLYGIANSENKLEQNKLPDQVTSSINLTQSNVDKNVKYNDQVEVFEENYELYLETDIKETNEPPVYTNQSNDYASLLLKEITQSLKQHGRFIEARNRRGSQEKEIQTTKIEDTFIFDVALLKKKEFGKEKDLDKLEHSSEAIDRNFMQIQQRPPPPVSVTAFQSKLNGNFDVLAGIKLLSSQRHIEEEIFGEALSDEN